MALADWAVAGKASGVTYDAIHLNGRGANLMVEVVKTAMGVYGEPSARAQTVVARTPPPQPPAPNVVAAAQPPRAEPARAEPERRVVTSVQSRSETLPPHIEPARPSAKVEYARIETVPARVEPARVEEAQAMPRKKPSYRGHRQEMFAMSPR